MDWIKQELKGKKILIVDDDPAVVETLKEQLETAGINVVVTAATGAEALKLTEAHDPSLIIMDIQLPDMDGIDLARKINEIEPRPIMLLSGYANSDYIDRAKDAGIITYIVKPVTMKELLPSIVLTMHRFREMMSLKATVDDMKETLANRKIIEQAKGLLMERKSLSEREAFSLIRKMSQEQNKPMAEIARTLVMMQDLL
jgi:two-component system, response regulator PdtaR